LIIGGYISTSEFSYLTVADDIVAYSMDVYPLSALLLFGVLGWSISKSFRTIRKEINDTTKKAVKLSQMEVAELLIKWRRCYMIVCKSAKRLNRCFGWILLIEIPYIFVEFIFTSFFIIYSTTENIKIIKTISWILLSASIKIFCLIQLFVISYVADVIPKEVWPTIFQSIEFGANFKLQGPKLMKALCHLQVSIPQLSNQLHQLMMQVHCSIPQVEVLGLFSVGRKLIPTVRKMLTIST
jgi:7tm Chemosensory receptor